ncbi:MAG: SDR family NAD(P)-dependent oxidoreductase [Bacteroidetes bacterium]|nr:SDR family NAD(P)-dependent oxidoreductase [Bacteroidota bacterium]
MNKIILITGATSGIGKATALLFAENGFKLIICGRRQERLEKLAFQLKEEFGADSHQLCFDIMDYEAVKNAIASLPEAWKNIDVLVNNAGLAVGLSDIQDGEIADWEQMIDTNIKGLLYMTKEVSRGMIKNHHGHIVNVGSIAGKEAYPKGNVYCATKFAVDALTRSTRIDMLPHNIRVTAINPGLLETEFSLVRFKGDADRAKTPYMGLTPLSAFDVAETIYFATSRPAHVNIAEITLTPSAQATARDVVREG